MSGADPQPHRGLLPPTSPALRDDATRPYFLWWTETTVGQLKEHLADDDLEKRAYWIGALLREANTRDVWLFVTPDEIRALWPHLLRHLGRSRDMCWSCLRRSGRPSVKYAVAVRLTARACLRVAVLIHCRLSHN